MPSDDNQSPSSGAVPLKAACLPIHFLPLPSGSLSPWHWLAGSPCCASDGPLQHVFAFHCWLPPGEVRGAHPRAFLCTAPSVRIVSASSRRYV